MNKAQNKFSLFKLSLPIFLQILLTMLLGYIDTFMLSHYNENAVGAVGLANQMIVFINLAFLVISSSSGIVINQYLGAKKTKEMNKVYTLSILFNFLLSIVISLIVVNLSIPLLKLLRTPDSMLGLSASYMKIVSCFLFTQSVNMVFNQIFNSHGKTYIGLILLLTSNIVNILGNYLFLYGSLARFNLGVRGVALSTCASSLVCLLLSFIAFKRIIKGKLSLKALDLGSLSLLKKLLKLGLPSAGENISYNIAQLIIAGLVNTMGEVSINAKVYCGMLTMFSMVYSNALSQATEIIVGHIVGEGDYNAAFNRGIKSAKSALLVSVSIAFINYLASPYLLRLLTSNMEIIRLANKVMLVAVILEAGRCLNLVIIQSMKAAGDVIYPTILGMLSMWGVSVIFSFVLGRWLNLGLIGVWAAMAADEDIRAIVVTYRWIKRKWEGHSVVNGK